MEAVRGGGGSREGAGGSLGSASCREAGPTTSIRHSWIVGGARPWWRPKPRVIGVASGSWADRNPPQGLESLGPGLPQSQPPRRQTLPVPQQQSCSISPDGRAASRPPVPIQRQIETARPRRSQAPEARIGPIWILFLSPRRGNNNTLWGGRPKRGAASESATHPPDLVSNRDDIEVRPDLGERTRMRRQLEGLSPGQWHREGDSDP